MKCTDEVLLRNYILTLSKSHHKPKFIRAMMHDASDHMNLVDIDGNSTDFQGGLDFCLYTSEEQEGGDPSHNTNLSGILSKCMKAKRKFKQTYSLNVSHPDALVLGAITAIEDAGGPRIPM